MVLLVVVVIAGVVLGQALASLGRTPVVAQPTATTAPQPTPGGQPVAPVPTAAPQPVGVPTPAATPQGVPIPTPAVPAPVATAPVGGTPPNLSPAEADEARQIDDQPLVTLLPALRGAPAPAWVQPGVRLTYYSAAASIVGGRHTYAEDENGNWIDPTTGKHYRQEEVASASGQGFTQVNVAALDRAVALLDIRIYSILDANVRTPPITMGCSGAITLPGAGSDYWVNPEVLQAAVGLEGSGTKILRTGFPINGQTHSAIRIQFDSASSQQDWIYDEQTGVLLHSGSSTVGQGIQGPVAQGDSRQGSTLLT
jgi:hypothetical protein